MTIEGLPSISVAQLHEQGIDPAKAILLDVREDDEWAAGHAPDAVHIPMGELSSRLEELDDKDVYVVCRSGGRSARVTQFLNQNGWDATNVDGGMSVWAHEQRALVTDNADAPRVI